MKSELITEVAFLYLSNPRYWSRDRICKSYGIKPSTLDKMMVSSHWQRVERVVKLNETVKKQTADQYFKEDHAERLEKYYDGRLNLGGIQSAMTLHLGKLLMRAILELSELKDDELLDGMKEHSQNISNYAKTFCLIDSQSMTNSNLSLAIETILDRIELNEEPQQLELFP